MLLTRIVHQSGHRLRAKLQMRISRRLHSRSVYFFFKRCFSSTPAPPFSKEVLGAAWCDRSSCFCWKQLLLGSEIWRSRGCGGSHCCAPPCAALHLCPAATPCTRVRSALPRARGRHLPPRNITESFSATCSLRPSQHLG